MKQKAFAFAVFICACGCSAFAQCPVNTITTDPNNYQNASDPSAALKWDWMAQSWIGYRNGTSAPISYQITSPFFDANSNPNLPDIALVSVKNYKPENGWEYIAKNFGSTLQGNDAPWFILYNRYTGTMRIFVQINSSYTNFQSAKLTLSFTKGFNSSALLSQQGINTLSLDQLNGRAMTTVPNQYVNSGQGSNQYFWLYGDFNTLYDPCSCKKYSRLNLQAFLFSNWDVTLNINGTISTKVVQVVNSSSTVVKNDNFGFGFDHILDGATNFISGVQKFTDVGNKLVTAGQQFSNSANGILTGKNTPFTSSFFDALLGTGGVFPSLKAIFSIPSLISSIFEKANSRPVEQTITTTTFAESKLTATATGNITQNALFSNTFVSTPGSDKTNVNYVSTIAPVYQNTLGVFNLIEKPKLNIDYYKTYTQYNNEQIVSDPDCIYNGNCQPTTEEIAMPIQALKLSGGLKYILNPASGLKITKMQVGLVFRMDWSFYPTIPGDATPTYGEYGQYSSFSALDEKKLNKLGFNLILKKSSNSFRQALISTQFVPASCTDNLAFYMGGGGSDSIGLRVFLEMEPINPPTNTTVNKILQEYTFYYTSNDDVVSNLAAGYYPDAISIHSGSGYPPGSYDSGPWALNNTNTLWNGAEFVSIPTNLKLENETISNNLTVFRDLEIGSNVVFDPNVNITLYVLGNLINNSGGPLPSNVTVVNNISAPCALSTLSPTDPTTFCNSTKYNDLTAILSRTRPTVDSLAQTKASDLFINKIEIKPNPAKDKAIISFDLLKKSPLKISVYNSATMKVLEVESRNSYSASSYNIDLNTQTLTSGLYVVKIESNEFTVTKKLLIVK